LRLNWKILKYDLVMLIAAAIWGFAFVAQIEGMKNVGPFTFIAVRFALGALSLVPLMILFWEKFSDNHLVRKSNSKLLLQGGIIAGILLFLGASFQQVGLQYTTAGNGGFITGLYVVMVPIAGIFWKHRTGVMTWIGAGLAAVGLYFLTSAGTVEMSLGNWLVFVCAICWTFHVITIGSYSPRVDSIKLAFIQFALCSFLAFIVALIYEKFVLQEIMNAALPIIYAGVFSSGIAFTLQIVGQKVAPPAHASIILSLESVFAVLGGWLLLSETLGYRSIIGCVLMLCGMIMSQLRKNSGD
jgi:drug/metabolite transporter (DMT)-like permease